MGLINHLPLPSFPFQTHDNIVFQNNSGDRSKKVNEVHKVTDKEELSKATPQTSYTYNPNPNKLRTPDGQIVDFIIA
jgi:hypothetical protein